MPPPPLFAPPLSCPAPTKKPETAMAEPQKVQGPLLAPWTGPWAGVPPFGKFKPAELQPVMEEAMAMNLAEIDQIAANPEPPAFENTIVAMEKSGQELDRASAVFGVFTSTMNDDEMQKIEEYISPRLAAFNDKIVQNAKLFARVAAVYEKRDSLS